MEDHTKENLHLKFVMTSVQKCKRSFLMYRHKWHTDSCYNAHRVKREIERILNNRNGNKENWSVIYSTIEADKD
jgi:hypothetical protein